MPHTVLDAVMSAPLALCGGSVLERLHRMPGIELDPMVGNAGLLYNPAGRAAMEAIYSQYLDIGSAAGVPMLLGTPTWRANKERLTSSGFKDRPVIADAVEFLEQIRAARGSYANQIVLGGLVACRGDAYQANEALGEEEALEFHAWQVDQLAVTTVDYLRGATLPALCEALGMARAMAATGRSYVLSFVIGRKGEILDGTPLDDVIERIDGSVDPAPWFYTLNCVHPTIVLSALHHLRPNVMKRVHGLSANGSALSPEELDDSAELISDEPEALALQMALLHRHHGFRIMGGCCGTDHRHIQAIAEACAPLTNGR